MRRSRAPDQSQLLRREIYRNIVAIVVIGVGAFGAVSPGSAQTAVIPPKTTAEPTPKTTAKEEEFRKFTEQFAVPDSPAAHVVGVAPEQVIHAQTPKQLIAELINGLDEHGNLQNGFAIDFAPMQVYLGRDRPVNAEMDAERYARGAKESSAVPE